MKTTFTQIATVMVIIAAAPFILNQQQSIAQEQPKQQQFLANQTTLYTERPVDDLSFEIDNVTFSHHTSSVNGIQLHYVMGVKEIL
jgi:hypothetical protein